MLPASLRFAASVDRFKRTVHKRVHRLVGLDNATEGADGRALGSGVVREAQARGSGMLNRLSDVAFWPHRSDRDTASFRVRCAAIVDGLRRHGVAARFYQPGDPPPAVLVMSKRYDAQSVAHAQALRHPAGTRWALDLCDNHFIVPPDALPGDELAVRAAQLIGAVQAADWVITSSEPLRREIEGRVPPVRGLSVIEDAVDEIAQPSCAAGPPARPR